MPAVKGSFLSYDEKDMIAAVKDVRLHKTPIRSAAKRFNVPRTTLKYKVEGRVPLGRKMGPSSVLTTEEEHTISLWVEKMDRAGFPVTATELIVNVEKFIKDVKRTNCFKDGRPGRTWLKNFLKRNPSISKSRSQNLTTSRAAITQENLKHLKEGLEFLNKNIEPAKLAAFHASPEVWSGDVQDTSLFMLWRRIRVELEKLSVLYENRATTERFETKDMANLSIASDDLPSVDKSCVNIFTDSSLLSENLSNELIGEAKPVISQGILPTEPSLSSNVGEPGPSPATCERPGPSPTMREEPGPATAISEEPRPITAISEESELIPIAGPSNIPNPLKKHVYYLSPTKMKNTKYAKRERMPVIVSGVLCQNYFKRKIEKKKEQEKVKLEKAQERERKKGEKLQQQKIKQLKNRRKQIVSDSTDLSSGTVTPGERVMSEESENEDFENQNWKKEVKKSIDEHVIVKHELKLYPGKIISISSKTATVLSMKQCGRRLWKWPDRPDVLEYPWKSVISHINSPKKVSKTRNVFSVPEFDFVWN